VAVVLGLASDPESLFAGTPTMLKIGLVLPVLGLVLTVAAAWYAIVQWRKGEGTVSTRLRHSAVVVIALLFFWSLNTWNLLGWRV
jgi:hypothetical protein